MPRPIAPPLDPKLVENMRKGVVVPWIGAGFSVPLGYPQMRGLLTELLRELHSIEFGLRIDADAGRIPSDRADRHARYRRYQRELESAADYAEIAEGIRELSKEVPHEFYSALRTVLVGIESRNRDRSSLGHYFLSLLGFCRVVTTNYDRLIERHVLPMASVITGADLRSIEYYGRIATSDPVVLKLHGDIGRPDTIPFTTLEFEDLYQAPAVKEFITDLIQNSSLLFIGTSLGRSEKYFDLLRDLFRKVSPPTGLGRKYDHFALLEMPKGVDQDRRMAVEERERQLKKLGIRPVWYETSDNEHSQIYEYLANLASAARPHNEAARDHAREIRSAYGSEDRPLYLAAQLSYEKRAAAVTFVTQDLTNAIGTDDYIQIDCIDRRLRTAPAYGHFAQKYWDSVTSHMLARRDNLLARAMRGELTVRALCSRKGIRSQLERAFEESSKEGDFGILNRLIARYRFTFERAAESPALDVRLSDGFRQDAAISYTPDSYALIVVPCSEPGQADLVMAFAPQATFGVIQTHLIEVNSELVRERAAHAEEMWWSATSEADSLIELKVLVQEYAEKLGPALAGR